MIHVLIAAIYKDGTKTEYKDVYEDTYGTGRSLKITAPKNGKIVSWEATGPIFTMPIIGVMEPPFKVRKGDWIEIFPITLGGCDRRKPT